ncbi:hypothetical protein [Halobacterium wangiae]|uniref:hypothetical protein n=1 Tax=Halobacterium wangiae TaxID=2902623 RepID=UPI001E3BA304|nr:hypothetical protein [Halobacterium wangiae]
MQRKPVPPAPDSLSVLRAVRAAVPLVPKPEDDCCRRVTDRTDVADRGTASSWLVFLAALGAVAEEDTGYARTQTDLDREDLASAFTDGVFLAADCLDALDATDPRSAEAVFESVRDRVPRWERTKRENWPAFWTERVQRRLDWAVLLGLARETDGGYLRA